MKEVAPFSGRTRNAALGTEGNAYRSNCFQLLSKRDTLRLRRNILFLKTVILNLLAQSNHWFVRARGAFQGFWAHQRLSSFCFLLIFLPVLLKLGPLGFVVAWSLWELGPPESTADAKELRVNGQKVELSAICRRNPLSDVAAWLGVL